MSVSLYQLSVPTFERCLTALLALLDKAEAHAKARNFDPTNYLALRLAPDMFPLVRQVQTCCDNAKNGAARLAGVAAPAFEDKEATFAEFARSGEPDARRPEDARREGDRRRRGP